jgi:uncharacterized protein YciI
MRGRSPVPSLEAQEVSQLLWVIHCLDKPGAGARREAARTAHSAHLDAGGVRPVLFGRLVAGDGTTAIGSLIVVDADERGQVERFVAEDPFLKADVWEAIHIHGFLQSTRTPIPLVPV